ncbi:hypothetical protein BABINDRAFT_162404 [Babjeviella inositovora NRRL Y-12698]|uniref:Kinase n=1 Tax=Babjeviella inositovora NRRL Y-12698 TaxID=984486 RepID=A0A1E3QP01_9ASCO|nr:uncharacterized protein BABINDRAFT_162404 [Babjeviella inositovora NRRL Y-12698]ODQ78707.1 hypothetical protein BABINDRAFT_162404 [Babjeviella inositovora NRRL Y-12698]
MDRTGELRPLIPANMNAPTPMPHQHPKHEPPEPRDSPSENNSLEPVDSSESFEIPPVVAGRKAAKSFKLFELPKLTDKIHHSHKSHRKEPKHHAETEFVPSKYGSSTLNTLLSQVSLDKEKSRNNSVEEELIGIGLSTAKDVSLLASMTDLQPVSSATYFPHKSKSDPTSFDDEVIHPEHLRAEAEFDINPETQKPENIRRDRGHKDRARSAATAHHEATPHISSDGTPADKGLGPSDSKVKKSIKFDIPEIAVPGLLEALPDPFHKTAGSFDHEAASYPGQAPGSLEDHGTAVDEDSHSLAVELTPFQNKVGGHTAIFRFSHRAVCKALVNRENIWYEEIEQKQPELLPFVPRYLGVLNVRYTSLVEDDSNGHSDTPPVTAVSQHTTHLARQIGHVSAASTPLSPGRGNTGSIDKTHFSTLSPAQELNFKTKAYKSAPNSSKLLPSEGIELPPEVVLDDNKHIIPESLLNHYSSSAPSPYGSYLSSSEGKAGLVDPNNTPKNSPYQHGMNELPQRDGGYLGSTKVNQRLQALVLQEVFAPGRKVSGTPSRHRNSTDGDSGSYSNSYSPRNEMLYLSERYPGADHQSYGAASSLYRHRYSDVDRVSVSKFRDARRSSHLSNLSSPHNDSQSCGRRNSLVSNKSEGRGDAIFEMDDDDTMLLNRGTELAVGNGDLDAKSTGLKRLANLTPGFISSHNSSASLMHMGGGLYSDGSSGVGVNGKLRRKLTRIERFILLEDLTSGMNVACALDLKMGTRQYGIEAKTSKMLSQRKKCRRTTSRSMGVRICGMKVWDKADEKYVSRDKYFGRNVRPGRQFAKCLLRFLYDGESLYSIVRHLPKLIENLYALYKVFSQLKGYRMYGSSLLLMYDSVPRSQQETTGTTNATSKTIDIAESKQSYALSMDEENNAKGGELIIRIIDFAQSLTPGVPLTETTTYPPRHANDIDKGYIKGLTSLLQYATVFYRKFMGADYVDKESALRLIKASKQDLLQQKYAWLQDFDNHDFTNDAAGAFSDEFSELDELFPSGEQAFDDGCSD